VRTKGEGRSPFQTPAEANVTARLFKSRPVRDVMEGVEEEVRKIVGVPKQDDQSTRKAPEWKDKDVAQPDAPVGESVVSSNSGYRERVSKTESRNQSVELGQAKEASLSEEDGYGQYDARLASDSESLDDASSDAGNKTAEIFFKKDMPYNDVDMEDLSDSEPEPSPASPPRLSKAQGPRPTKTTFLPSLAAGYISGSDAGSQVDEEIADIKPRKNRMGQQARRLLWEQRYGSSANHLKEQSGKGGKKDRNAGWDAKRGATDGTKPWMRRAGKAGGDRKERDRSDKGSQTLTREVRKPRTQPKDDGPLHPSWEAKKRMKEQKQQVAFAGKKVVFD
jgi:hypothetical protein